MVGTARDQIGLVDLAQQVHTALDRVNTGIGQRRWFKDEADKAGGRGRGAFNARAMQEYLALLRRDEGSGGTAGW